MSRPLSAALLGLGLLLLPAAARAHGIESSLTRLQAVSDALMLQSQFSSGEPTRDAVVRLVPPGGEPIEVGRTDSQGQLSFSLPKGASGAWEVQVDGGPGHRDYLEMPVQRGQAQLEQLSRQPSAGGWNLAHLPAAAGLSGLGAAAMLLGLQRIRRPR